jgi:hypothetical protein
MPRIYADIPDELHAKAKELKHLFSISKLTHLGLIWAVQHYSNWTDPAAIGAVTAPRYGASPPTSNPTASSPSSTTQAPGAAHAPAKRISIDPVGDALKPWKDHRKHEWYDLGGFMEYLGLTQDVIAKVIDWDEDTDLDPQERPILDRAAIERIFVNLSSKAYASVDRYHAVNAWFEARDADERLLAARELQT